MHEQETKPISIRFDTILFTMVSNCTTLTHLQIYAFYLPGPNFVTKPGVEL